jgi:pimeloyl-ACP methyl ester carboxylesterase
LLCFKPPRPQPASLLGGRLGLSHAFRNSCLCKGDSGCSNGQHTQAGAADGQPVFLLHGWPYDPRSFDDVVSPLASAGFRVIVPYLRCFGPTVYRDSSIFRSGEQAALGKDVIDLMDALSIPKAILAGFDWGNRAACVAAALWPERVRAFVSTTGYTILNVPNLTKNMARVPDAACIEHVGLRLFLCPDGLVPDASRLLRHPACEQGDLPRCSDPASDSRLGRAANRGMLRLGSSAAAILDSRSRQPLWRELRSSRAGSRNTTSSYAVQVTPSQCRR